MSQIFVTNVGVFYQLGKIEKHMIKCFHAIFLEVQVGGSLLRVSFRGKYSTFQYFETIFSPENLKFSKIIKTTQNNNFWEEKH